MVQMVHGGQIMARFERARGRVGVTPVKAGTTPLKPALKDLEVELDGEVYHFVDLDSLPPLEQGDTWAAYMATCEGDESLARLLDDLAKADAWIAEAHTAGVDEPVTIGLEIIADGEVAPELVDRVRERKADLLAYLERQARLNEALAPLLYEAICKRIEAREAALAAWLEKSGNSLDVESD